MKRAGERLHGARKGEHIEQRKTRQTTERYTEDEDEDEGGMRQPSPPMFVFIPHVSRKPGAVRVPSPPQRGRATLESKSTSRLFVRSHVDPEINDRRGTVRAGKLILRGPKPPPRRAGCARQRCALGRLFDQTCLRNKAPAEGEASLRHSVRWAPGVARRAPDMGRMSGPACPKLRARRASSRSSDSAARRTATCRATEATRPPSRVDVTKHKKI